MNTKQLDVAVVGAGIAGLTLAAALSRAGIAVGVFEQAQELREVGAGIQIAPNASRVLHRLGLAERLAHVAVQPAAIEMRRWDTNDTLLRNGLGAECEQMYGTPYYTVHRADLHTALRELLPSGTVHLGLRCTSVDERPDRVLLNFHDGSALSAAVVVGADGIHSVLRGSLVADEPRFSGQTIYRGLVPAERLGFLREEPKVMIWFGPDQHFVCYPVSGGRFVSFAATTPSDAGQGEAGQGESWQSEGRVADALAAYSGWHPQVREVISAADSVQKWALYDREPVSRWSTRRLTLIGDAAHPMLPFGAQGAAQAIEDAAALAVCLSDVDTDGIPAALQRYEGVRKPRTTAVYDFIRSNAKNHHYGDGERQRERDKAMSAGRGLRDQAWLFGYDARSAALAVAQPV